MNENNDSDSEQVKMKVVHTSKLFYLSEVLLCQKLIFLLM